MPLPDFSAWNFDIDRFLNPFIPPPPWRFLPYPISYWFGYRKGSPRNVGNLVAIFWAFIGVFCAILIIEAASRHVHSFQEHGAPIIIASFGAAAVLEFFAIDSPLAQPRNAVFGQVIASIIGVGVCKLFALSPHFESIRWVGGALACATTTAVMALTKTVHPPAGATALLAVTNDDSLKLGWYLIPVMLLGCALMLGTALLVNNIQRRFPTYWWTAADLSRPKPADNGAGVDIESKLTPTSSSSDQGSSAGDEPQLVVRRGAVLAPDQVSLSPEEKAFLEELSKKI